MRSNSDWQNLSGIARAYLLGVVVVVVEMIWLVRY
jgi:hypothetical protein